MTEALPNSNLSGLFATHNGCIVALSLVACNNDEGVNSQFNSHIRSENLLARYNLTSGVECRYNSVVFAPTSVVEYNTNGFYADRHAFIYAVDAAASNNTTDYSPAINTDGNNGSLIYK